eukprot:jgi/Tetstr1/427806/TSEL_001778.t2
MLTPHGSCPFSCPFAADVAYNFVERAESIVSPLFPEYQYDFRALLASVVNFLLFAKGLTGVSCRRHLFLGWCKDHSERGAGGFRQAVAGGDYQRSREPGGSMRPALAPLVLLLDLSLLLWSIKGLDGGSFCQGCLQGATVASAPGCPAAADGLVHLDACGLPEGLLPGPLDTSLSCRFVPREYLGTGASQGDPWPDSYLHAVLEADPVPVLLPLGEGGRGGGAQWGRRSCEAAAEDASAPPLSCTAPNGGSWAVALVWDRPAAADGNASLVLTRPAAVPAPQNVLQAAHSSRSKSANQSVIVLSGVGLSSPLACELRDGALLAATVLNDTSAVCILPAAAPGPVVAIRGAAGCAPLRVVVEPSRLTRLGVVDVEPKAARRAGPTELSVSLAPGAAEWVLRSPGDVDGQLFCRLVGAANAGQADLLMPGQLIRGPSQPVKVGCSTPERPQLPRASLPLEVGVGHSLSAPMVVDHALSTGEVADEGVSAGEDHVLFAGGGLPVVSLLDGSSLVLANDSRVYVQVGMQGQSSALVTASLQLQERGVGGSPLRLSPRGPLIEAEAVWPPGSSGSQVVALVLPPGGDSAAASAPGKLQVALTNVTNAELGDARTTALQLEADLPAFGVLSAPAPLYAAELDPDRRDVVRVAFSLGPLQPGAVLHRSVAVDVRLVVLTPEWASLVRLPRASLQWESCGGSRPPCRPQEVAVDILPDALDDTVYLRAMLALNTSSNARVDAAPGVQPLLHVLGSPRGVCPLGTRTAEGDGAAPAPAPSSWSLEQSAGTAAVMASDLAITTNSSGTTAALPVSPRFRPEVLEYGAHVGSQVEAITLDLKTTSTVPIQVEAIYRSSHLVLEPSALGNLMLAGANISDATAVLKEQQQQQLANVTVEGPHRRSLLGGDDEEGGAHSAGADKYAAACEQSSAPLALCDMLGQNHGRLARADVGEAAPAGAETVVQQPQEFRGKLRWRLPVAVGQNTFRVVPTAACNASAMGPLPPPYTLSVTRLADPAHAELASVRVLSLAQNTLACDSSAAAADAPQRSKAWQQLDGLDAGPTAPSIDVHRPCAADGPIDVELLDDGGGSGSNEGGFFLALTLKHAGVPGVRVEVGSEVLDGIGAGTLPLVALPLAAAGSGPAVTSVRILVVAEDGVTSATYTLRLNDRRNQDAPRATRLGPSESEGVGKSEATGGKGTPLGTGGGAPSVPAQRPPRSAGRSSPSRVTAASNATGTPEPLWPPVLEAGLPPLALPDALAAAGCEACERGYWSGSPDSVACGLCRPGSFSPSLAGRCYPCRPGGFSPVWGAGECRQCGTGTYTPWPGARACLLCPPHLTTPSAGAGNCSQPAHPTDLSTDYAVIVQLRVAFLVDTADLEDVTLRTSLVGSIEAVVAHLLRLDTASVFRVPLADVEVGLHVLHPADASGHLIGFMAPAARGPPMAQLAAGNQNETSAGTNSSSRASSASSDSSTGRPADPSSPPAGWSVSNGTTRLRANQTASASGSGPDQNEAATGDARAASAGLPELPAEVVAWLALAGNDSSGAASRRRLLTANVTATLAADVNLQDDSSDDITAKVNVQELSADNGIELLAKSPDAFFSRTTKALNAQPIVAPETVQMEIHDPTRRGWFGIPVWAWVSVGASTVSLLGLAAALCSRRLRALWALRWRRMPAFSLHPTPSGGASAVPGGAELVPPSASRLGLTRLRSGLGGGGGGEELGLVSTVSSSAPEWTCELKER